MATRPAPSCDSTSSGRFSGPVMVTSPAMASVSTMRNHSLHVGGSLIAARQVARHRVAHADRR